MKIRPEKSLYLVFAALAAFTASQLCAQNDVTKPETPPPSTEAVTKKVDPAASEKKAEEEDEDLITLSTFYIKPSEKGYVSSNSLSGSRAGLNIEETPFSIEVLTSDLIDEYGITDMNSALAYFGGISSKDEVSGADPFQDWDTSSRNLGNNSGTGSGLNGTGSASPPTRNYFNVHFNFDTYNISTIELSRGPNSFFNVGSESNFGSVNTATKSAVLNKNINQAKLRVSSFGGGRATVDFNRPIGKKAAIRFNGLWDDQYGWQEVERTKKEGFHIAATYRPFKSTEIRAEVEYGQIDRYLPFRVQERYSGWNGVFSNYTGVGSNNIVSGSGTAFIRTNISTDVYIYNPAVSLNPVNYRGFHQTNNSANAAGRQVLGADFADEAGYLFPILLGPDNNPLTTGTDPKTTPILLPNGEVSLMYDNTPAQNPVRNAAVYINHQFNRDFGIELAGAFFSQKRILNMPANLLADSYRIDMNNFLPGGAPNPYVGQFYVQAVTGDSHQANHYYYGRFQAAYQNNSRWLKARLLAGVNYNWEDFLSNTYRYLRDDGVITLNNANAILVRRYLNERHLPFIAPEGSGPGYTIRRVRTASGGNHKFSWNYQTAFTGTWLPSQRLKTIASIRFDQRYRASLDGYAADARGEFIIPTVLAATPAPDKNSMTYNYGANFSINENTHLYASYSQHLPDPVLERTDSNGNPIAELLGTGLPQPQNENTEFGIKGSFFKKKLSYAITYFESSRINSPTNELSASAGGDIDEKLELIFQNAGITQTVPSGYYDVRDSTSKGIEVQLTANVSKSLSLRASISKPDTTVSSEFPLTQSYISANRNAWLAAATNLGPAQLTAVSANLTAIDDAINNFGPGRPLRGTFNYNGSVSGTYRITSGRLNGLSFALTAFLKGERLVNSYPKNFVLNGTVVTPYDFYKVDPYQLYNLSINYKKKIYGKNMSFQVLIENLLDNRSVLPSGTSLLTVDSNGRVVNAATAVATVPSLFSYTSPLRASFTTTIDF